MVLAPALLVTGTVTLWSAAGTESAVAQNRSYAWCAIYSGRSMGGSKNCSFNAWEQCQAQVSGIGGFCQPNYYASTPQPRRKMRRFRAHR
jgi:hypothetical protein